MKLQDTLRTEILLNHDRRKIFEAQGGVLKLIPEQRGVWIVNIKHLKKLDAVLKMIPLLSDAEIAEACHFFMKDTVFMASIVLEKLQLDVDLSAMYEYNPMHEIVIATQYEVTSDNVVTFVDTLVVSEMLDIPIGYKGCASDACGMCRLKSPKLRHCKACKVILYCGKICQKKHWALHKPLCLSNRPTGF
jgi:hypothetical protein